MELWHCGTTAFDSVSGSFLDPSGASTNFYQDIEKGGSCGPAQNYQYGISELGHDLHCS